MTIADRPGQSPLVVSADDVRIPSCGPPPSPPNLHDLFIAHAGYVWNSLRRLGVPPPDLEDSTHDVFLQVGRHIGDVDSSRPVRPWLFAFCFRIASQQRRRAYRRRERQGETDEMAHPGPMPDEHLAAEERRSLVLAALQGVDIERRAVFVLYEIDRTPMADIAKTLGIPVNTGYSRLRVARKEFAAAVKRLQRQGGER